MEELTKPFMFSNIKYITSNRILPTDFIKNIKSKIYMIYDYNWMGDRDMIKQNDLSQSYTEQVELGLQNLKG